VRSLVGTAVKLLNKTGDAPVAYSAPGRYAGFGAMTGRGDNETYMRSFGSAGTIFQIVSLLAGSCAAPEWRLYRKPKADGRQRYTTGDRGSDQRIEVLQHQALNVWNAPNPFSTGVQFREAGWQHMELTGEQWWIVARDSRASFPTGLWLVRPDRMEPVPSVEKYIAGYIYTGPSGEKVPLRTDEVILTKFPNPLDPYRGLGPVQSVLVDIDAMKYSAEWNRNFFINSATVGGVIQVPGSMDDPEFDRFSARWREAHQGVSRAHRVAVLEGGAEYIPNQSSMKDMDFVNLRGVSRDVLREAWGIHKSMLGNADDVNRANSQTAEEVFGRWKILPRLDRQRDILNSVYLPLFGTTGEGVEFDYVNPLPDDREADNAELTAKTSAYSVLIQAGVDPEEAAKVVGLPPMKHVTPVPALPPVPTADQGEQDEQAGNDPAENDAPVQNRLRNITAPRVLNAVADGHDPSQVDLSEMDAQHQQAVDQLAADYAQQITPEQRAEAIQQIKDAVRAGAIGALGAIIVDYLAAKALILGAMLHFGTTAAKQAAKEAEKQGVTIQPVAPSSIQLEGLAEVTAATMASELGTVAGREAARYAGGTANPDADQVATHVETFLSGLSGAATKTHLAGALSAAQNQARHATFLAGPRTELIASEILDFATCENCEDIEGHSFGFTDDPAAVAEASAAYPTAGYIYCKGLERCRGALIARYPIAAEPENRLDGDVMSMLHRLVDLLEPTGATLVNGHDHGAFAQ
jgi:HK97 family phage portal protein